MSLKLDAIDLHALALLMERGRATWADLASTLRLSSVAVAQRVRRLERSGVIRGYATRVDPESVGLGLAAFVGVTLAPHGSRERFLKVVDAQAEIQECHHVTGELDYLLKVRCAGTRELEALIHALKERAGVASSRTQVVLSTAKETSSVPLPAPGAPRPRGAAARGRSVRRGARRARG